MTLVPSWGWDSLRDMFRTRIRDRDWPPGALIPNEAQLAADLGVARATVNRALQALAEEGLLERRKRAGTRVAALPNRRARLEIPVIRLEVEALGEAYSFALTHDRDAPLPSDVAGRMKLTPGASLRHLTTEHRAGKTPFAYEDRWLNMAALGRVADFGGLSVNEWLVAHVPFEGGELALFAAPAGRAEASALAVPEGTALMVTERVTFGPSGAITHVRLWHRPGYRVEMVL